MPDNRIDVTRLRSVAGPDQAVSPETVRAARTALLHAAADERAGKPTRNRRPRRWRRAGLALAASTFVVAVGAGAYLDFVPRDPSAGLLCAESISTEPSGSVIPDDGRSFAVQCANVWQSQGRLNSSAASGPITACNSGHGAVYVYQADASVCGRLGLPKTDAASGS